MWWIKIYWITRKRRISFIKRRIKVVAANEVDSTLPSVIIYNWNCVTAPAVPLHLHFLVDSYGRLENCATGSVVFLSQSVTHRWNTNLWNFSMSSVNDCGRQYASAAGELTSCSDRPTSPWLIDVIKHSLHFALFALSRSLCFYPPLYVWHHSPLRFSRSIPMRCPCQTNNVSFS